MNEIDCKQKFPLLALVFSFLPKLGFSSLGFLNLFVLVRRVAAHLYLLARLRCLHIDCLLRQLVFSLSTMILYVMCALGLRIIADVDEDEAPMKD